MTRKLSVNPGDRFLISRTDRLGDLILTLPLIGSLKARFPMAEIDILASSYAAPILQGNPDIRSAVPIEPARLTDKAYFREVVQLIKARNYQFALAVYPDRLVAQLLKDSRIPHRIGTTGRLHSLKFNHRLYHSRKRSDRHESEYNLDFLRFFADGPTVCLPSIKVTPDEIARAGGLLKANSISAPFVVLHPGSSGSADAWPVARFVELSDILRMGGMPCVFTGSEPEGLAIGEMLSRRDSKSPSVTGKTDLRTLAAILSLASVVVANSTGPLHLAAAVGTKVVGLYPHKRVMAPRRWRPLGDGHRVVQPASAICRCTKGQCECMFSISAQTVAEQVQAIWAENAQRKQLL